MSRSPLGDDAPAGLAVTRVALHRLAAYVIAPVRHQATGRFGLRATPGGFGTPAFGDDRQIRVEGMNLVDRRGDTTTSAPITTLRAAADFLGTEIDAVTTAESDSPPVGDVDADLGIDESASRFLGAFYAMGVAGLELVRSDDVTVDPSIVQLWPGHFDAAIEAGDEPHRASYGASPGDDGIDEPYLYVSVWWPDRAGLDRADPFWNSTTFTGRVFRLSEFPAGADPVDTAATFWRATRDRLDRG